MPHRIRLIVLGVLAGLCILGEVILMAKDHFGESESTTLGALLALLIPAIIDASLVERRRRDPTRTALSDDVVDRSSLPERRPSAETTPTPKP